MTIFVIFLSESVKIELADDGRPAPAARPGDCCGLPSPTRSPDGSKRPKTDHFRVISAPKTLQAGAEPSPLDGRGESPLHYVGGAGFEHVPSTSNPIRIELADDGRPAPAALPGDCCGLPSWGPLGRRTGIRPAEN